MGSRTESLNWSKSGRHHLRQPTSILALKISQSGQFPDIAGRACVLFEDAGETLQLFVASAHPLLELSRSQGDSRLGRGVPEPETSYSIEIQLEGLP